jgi:DNA-directed RNA polymerase specialized sigma subunit
MARARYAAYIAEAIGKGRTIQNPLRNVGSSLILGSPDFISRIKKTFLSDKAEDREVPAMRGLKEKFDLETLKGAVEQTLKTKNKLSRNMTIFLCRKYADSTLMEIAEHFHISKSAIGKIYKQMSTLLAKDKVLKKAVRGYEDRLIQEKWKV